MWTTNPRTTPIMQLEQCLLTENLKLMGEMTRKGDYMQQTAALGTAYILRKALPIPA